MAAEERPELALLKTLRPELYCKAVLIEAATAAGDAGQLEVVLLET